MTYTFNRLTQRAQVRVRPGRPPTPMMAVLVGEVIYNLRAALDYLVYELARLDSGYVQNGTQFPIEDTCARFTSRRKTYLKGVNERHVATIKALQPFSGCDWTMILRDISNPDKHRTLTDTRGTGEVDVRMEYGSWTSFSGRPGKVFLAQGYLHGEVKDVYVETRLAIKITFSDESPVIETLELLCAKVNETLDVFERELTL